MPIPARVVDAELFRSLLGVLRDGASVEVRYQSMNPARPDALWRRVTPHAFGSDGLRWHVRGYCHIDHRYKDFVLSRLRGLRAVGAPGPTAASDRHRETIFNLGLEAHPPPSDRQRERAATEEPI